MAKKYLDFLVSANEAEEGLEEGKKYFIVCEEYHDQTYDICIGIFTDLDAAIECGKIHDDRKEVVMVTDYKDYTEGSFDPLWVSKIKAKMVTKISKYVEGSGCEYTTEYDSYDFDYRPDSFSWENVDDSWTDELTENEPEEVDYKVWYEIVDSSGDILDKSGEFFVRN